MVAPSSPPEPEADQGAQALKEAAPCRVQLLGRELHVCTDEALGVAGRPWPAQEVAARVAVELLGRRQGRRESTAVIELGAGCGALACALALELGCHTVSTDLPEVVPLIQRTAALNAAPVDCRSLPWGDAAAVSALVKVLAEKACAAAGAASRLVIACETAYWGGWDLFEDDTRGPLAETLDDLIGSGDVGLLVFEVRDATRERSLLAMISKRGLVVTRKEPSDREPTDGEVGVWTLRWPDATAAEGG